MSDLALRIDHPAQIRDVLTYLRRLLHLDDAAVVRIHAQGDRLRVWSDPGFGALGVRGLEGGVTTGDVVVAAAELADQLETAAARAATDEPVIITLGFPLAAAWHGALPPDSGFQAVDAVPAATIVDLARQGHSVARDDSGPLGVPPSLLDHEALTVSNTSTSVGVPMRMIFTLVGLGFVPEGDDHVLVRSHPSWVRLDARFGSAAWHRPTLGGLSVVTEAPGAGE